MVPIPERAKANALPSVPAASPTRRHENVRHLPRTRGPTVSACGAAPAVWTPFRAGPLFKRAALAPRLQLRAQFSDDQKTALQAEFTRYGGFLPPSDICSELHLVTKLSIKQIKVGGPPAHSLRPFYWYPGYRCTAQRSANSTTAAALTPIRCPLPDVV